MSELARLILPWGGEITVKFVRLDKGVILEPVSGNINRVHHHAYVEGDGTMNILIRDREKQNEVAYVYRERSRKWEERPLTDAEKKWRW